MTRPGLLKRLIGFCLVLVCFAAPAESPSLTEAAAFNAAMRAFQDAAYDYARRGFAEFARKFPQSAKVPEALLLQAQSALRLGDGKAAASLLTTNFARAGLLAEQYQYSLGEVYLQGSNYVAAAAAFERVLKDYPESLHRLESSYNQALARFNLKEWSRVIDLLQDPQKPFQKLASTRANDTLAVSGFLLLAEAQMENRQTQEAETTVKDLRVPDLDSELKWRRDALLCRIQIANGQFQTALVGSSNLIALANSAALPARRAESVTLQGGILERLNDLPAASAAYEQNLRTDVSTEIRRQSLLKIIELTLVQEELDEATRKLERLLFEHPTEAGADVARLTLGELRLKQYFMPTNGFANPTNSVPNTNTLQAALVQFDDLLRVNTNSALVGKAYLDRGWCLWTSGKTNESALAFKAAADRLPHGSDQAVARFKVGEILVLRNDYSNALDNFRVVLTNYDDLPPVRQSLLPHAWYHVLRSSIELNDLDQASAAMKEITQSYPESTFADRGVLLVGQELAPAEARLLFAGFAKRFPESKLVPEAELAVARTYEQEKKWDSAVGQYDQWVQTWSTNDLLPRAEFYRAWATGQAGRATNALNLYTSFLAQFPNHELAPLARNWIASFYYGQRDFVNAEINYQLLFQNTNWPVTSLSYQARMMAGRAAVAREGYRNAKQHFRDLVNDNNCPTNLVAEAFYALGDAMIADPETRDPPLETYNKAYGAFKKLIDLYPTNDRVPRALGRMGDCCLQMGAFNNKFYQDALDNYQKVISHPKADSAARSLAEIGLATVLEKEAKLPGADPDQLLGAAFDHYYNVVVGRDSDGEKLDAALYKQAGLHAARLAEDLKHWQIAINIYNRVSTLVPATKPAMDRKIERAREQLRSLQQE